MKLFVINGENNEENIEINIHENSLVQNIKLKLDEIRHGNGYSNKYFRSIHKNIALWDSNSLNYYKIRKDDKIWFGKIENYLRKDDFVVIFIFVVGQITGGEYLIMKSSDTISTIRSIVEEIYSKVINIWNADGIEIRDDQIVSEIHTNSNYKLIIRCDDGEGNEINNTFDQCRRKHGIRGVDRYLHWDQIRDDNKNESTRTLLRNHIDYTKQIISSNDTINDSLNQNLSDLPSSFLISTNLFCRNMTYYIMNFFWIHAKNYYENNDLAIFYKYFPTVIRAVLWNYSDFGQYNMNKSIINIVIDALDYFTEYLNDSNNDWRYWLRLWMNQYKLGSLSDDDVNERIDNYTTNNVTIRIKMHGNERNHFLSFKPKSIIEAKHSISKVLNVDEKYLCFIKPGGDDKPNDDDKFDDEFIIEIVFSMDDIKVLRLLGNGAFGRIHLCLDKTSNKHFILKIQIQKDRDLSRDINIYSKLNSSRNIMNYSGLFRHEESICIGMEYMSGGSLRSYLDRGKHLSEREVVSISHEILTQINELHKLGIIHRDIKSDNIVIDEHNHAKLIDFGISKYTTGLISEDLIDKLNVYKPGTNCYMAPELIKGKLYSEKIDIWSFGMVMVEMVTAKRPFDRVKPFQAVLKIRDCRKYEFEPIFPISNELNKFINSCLNANPDERPNAEQLIKSLNHLFVI